MFLKLFFSLLLFGIFSCKDTPRKKESQVPIAQQTRSEPSEKNKGNSNPKVIKQKDGTPCTSNAGCISNICNHASCEEETYTCDTAADEPCRLPGESEILDRSQWIGKKLPKLMLRHQKNDKKVELKSVGKLVVLDFWATWCSHCKKVDALLNRTHQKFGDKVDIYSITTESKTAIDKFLEKHPKPGLIVAEDYLKTSIKDWKVTAYPTVALLDKNHNIVSIMSGAKEIQKLDAQIQNLLQHTKK